MKGLFSIFISFTLVWGLEYKFKQIASIPHAPISEPFFIGDTDQDGLNEIILWTPSYDKYERPAPPWEIWEYRPGNIYEREYTGPPPQQDGKVGMFTPYAVDDVDKDGLSDIIGKYGCGDSMAILMLESPDPFSHPTEIVWGVKYTLGPGDTNNFWYCRPLITDIDKDGRNEYIIPCGDIFVAKCTGDNEIEFVDSTQVKEGEWIYDYSSILGDFDQDGKIEIVSGGEGGWDWQLEVYENTVGYKFKNVFRDSVPPYRGGAKVFSSKDSDGDGKPEIFLPYGRPTGYYKGVIYLYRWETTGDNNYSRILVDSARTDSGIPWGRSCCGDVDGDGIDEIIWSLGTDVYVYKSTGDDKYTRVWHWIPPYYKKMGPHLHTGQSL